VSASGAAAVALTTGARVNPLVSLLIWRLRQAGHAPGLILSTAPLPGLARLTKARRLGWRALQRRWSGPAGGAPAAADPAPIDAYARRRGYPSPWQPLPAVAVGAAVVRVSDLNGPDAVAALGRAGVQVVVNGGGGLFRPALLAAAPAGILNVHMGSLPRVRGMNALEWSLLLGVAPTATLHFVDAGIDTGDIIARQLLPVKEGDDIAALRGRFVPVAVELVAAHLAAVVAGRAPRQPQKNRDGRQYFALHPRLRRIAAARLSAMAGP